MMAYAGMSIYVRSPSNVSILQHSRLGKATVTCGTDILLPDTFHSFSIQKTPTAFFFSTTQQLPFSFSPSKLLTFNPPSLYFDLFRSQKLPSTCPQKKKPTTTESFVWNLLFLFAANTIRHGKRYELFFLLSRLLWK